MEKEPIVLRATIFPDEHPDLYDHLAKMLPKQKYRRRNVVIQILKAGCGVEEKRAGSSADVLTVQALVSQLASAIQPLQSSVMPVANPVGVSNPVASEPAAPHQPVEQRPSSITAGTVQAQASPYKGSAEEMDISDFGHLFSDV